ncbi:MAG: membrane protein insertion efficiency factor YidD [Patescibacteria group bacterium]
MEKQALFNILNSIFIIPKRFALGAIRFYQRFLSFDTGILKFLFLRGPSTGSGWTASTCRFTPTCSEYMYQAIAGYGIIHGLSLGIRRILRCHPWSKGGEDPVPEIYIH